MSPSIKYTNSYLESRSIPVLLVGNSTWIEDISRYLAKDWKQIQWAPTEDSFKEYLALGAPKMCFVEFGAFDHKELRLLEIFLPNTVRTILIGPDGSEGDLWQRLERRLCPYRVPALIMPISPSVAASEINEILENSISLGIYNTDEEFATIRAGFAGYVCGSRDRPSIIRNREFFNVIYSYLMSQYTFTVIETDIAMLLAETYDYWKTLKPPHDEGHHAYVTLENRLWETPALGLLELAVDLTLILSDEAPLGKLEWESLLKRNALAESSRKLNALHSDTLAIMAEYRKRNAKVS
ncbi:MAG: hypothetical protein AABZ55_13860 [Bdellovibrionota bacterium]